MNAQQNKIFHGILGKLALDAEERKAFKLAIVWEVSKNTKSHWNDLTDMEAGEAIRIVKNRLPAPPKSQEKGLINSQKDKTPEGDRMRKKLISIAYQLHWASVGDWKKAIKDIDAFLMTHGKHKKPMNDLSKEELVITVSQFDQLLVKHLKG